MQLNQTQLYKSKVPPKVDLEDISSQVDYEVQNDDRDESNANLSNSDGLKAEHAIAQIPAISSSDLLNKYTQKLMSANDDSSNTSNN